MPCGSSLVAVEADAGEILVGHDRDDGRKKGKGGVDWQGGSLRESYFRNMDRWGGGRGRGDDDPTWTSGRMLLLSAGHASLTIVIIGPRGHICTYFLYVYCMYWMYCTYLRLALRLALRYFYYCLLTYLLTWLDGCM